MRTRRKLQGCLAPPPSPTPGRAQASYGLVRLSYSPALERVRTIMASWRQFFILSRDAPGCAGATTWNTSMRQDQAISSTFPPMFRTRKSTPIRPALARRWWCAADKSQLSLIWTWQHRSPAVLVQRQYPSILSNPPSLSIRPAVQRADRRLLDKCAVLEIGHRMPQLLLRVHHDGAIPCDRLLNRLARYQQEPNALRSRLYRNLVAAVEQHQ
jgi:hypothetical protein